MTGTPSCVVAHRVLRGMHTRYFTNRRLTTSTSNATWQAHRVQLGNARTQKKLPSNCHLSTVTVECHFFPTQNSDRRDTIESVILSVIQRATILTSATRAKLPTNIFINRETAQDSYPFGNLSKLPVTNLLKY